MMNTIYKRTSTGKIQQWKQEINKDNTAYRTVSGQTDGKQVISEWYFCEPKNVGRSNQTTIEQQVQKEVESNYTFKLERGYVENIEDVDNSKIIPFKPMLAKKFEDYTIDNWENVYSNPKLDGVRCIAFKDHLLSRQGKEFVSVPHILEQLQPIFDKYGENLILDGEIYTHKLHNDFNQLISLVRKTKPTADDILESEQKVQYWIYDVPSIQDKFSNRQQFLESIKNELPDCFVVVPNEKVRDREHCDDLFASYIEDGMEGQILRFDGLQYENKRSKNLLKRKEFDDEEFVILDIEEGLGNRSGMAGNIVYQTKEGNEFRSGIRGNREYYKELLENKEKYIGKVATVVFFRYSNDGIPRFPVTKIIYGDKREL